KKDKPKSKNPTIPKGEQPATARESTPESMFRGCGDAFQLLFEEFEKLPETTLLFGYFNESGWCDYSNSNPELAAHVPRFPWNILPGGEDATRFIRLARTAGLVVNDGRIPQTCLEWLEALRAKKINWCAATSEEPYEVVTDLRQASLALTRLLLWQLLL